MNQRHPMDQELPMVVEEVINHQLIHSLEWPMEIIQISLVEIPNKNLRFHLPLKIQCIKIIVKRNQFLTPFIALRFLFSMLSVISYLNFTWAWFFSLSLFFLIDLKIMIYFQCQKKKRRDISNSSKDQLYG